MIARWMTALGAACLFAALPAQSKDSDKTTDAGLKAMMIGTWINPPDSADYEGVPSREIYEADGTYLYYEYEDKACQKLSASVTSRWYVWEGALFTQYEDRTLKDHIISLQPNKVVLRSVDDNVTYHRIKSTRCPTELPATATKTAKR